MTSNGDRRPVVVVGAGHMGHGLAVAYANGGRRVVLVDVDPAALDRAHSAIERVLTFLQEAGELAVPAAEVQAAIQYTTDSGRVADAWLVQETVNEDLQLKRRLFADLEVVVPGDAILATNTASMRLGEIAASMREPGRLVGLHWFHPPYVVPTVEVVATDDTDPAVVEQAVDAMRAIGKQPLPVRDVPGFVVNRLQTALRNAALSLVEQGIADPETVDAAVKYAIAPRQAAFGMFLLYDLIVNMRYSLHTSRYLHASTGEERYRPSLLMEAKVAAGETGLDAGLGWYDFRSLDRADVENRRDRAILAAYRAQRLFAAENIIPGLEPTATDRRDDDRSARDEAR